MSCIIDVNVFHLIFLLFNILFLYIGNFFLKNILLIFLFMLIIFSHIILFVWWIHVLIVSYLLIWKIRTFLYLIWYLISFSLIYFQSCRRICILNDLFLFQGVNRLMIGSYRTSDRIYNRISTLNAFTFGCPLRTVFLFLLTLLSL